MNVLQITGLVLIAACVVSILAAVFIGDRLSLFIAALVLGIVGNLLWWLGKPHREHDDSPVEPPAGDQKPGDQPPAG
ncbi:MAG: hypothetical protein TUN42_09445 [Dehalogenimonas sp.]